MEKRSFLSYLHTYNAVAHIVPCRTSLTRRHRNVSMHLFYFHFVATNDAGTHIEVFVLEKCRDRAAKQLNCDRKLLSFVTDAAFDL